MAAGERRDTLFPMKLRFALFVSLLVAAAVCLRPETDPRPPAPESTTPPAGASGAPPETVRTLVAQALDRRATDLA